MTSASPKPEKFLRRVQQSGLFMDTISGLAARHVRMVLSTSRIVRDPADTDARLLAHHPSIVAMWHGQFLCMPLIKPKTMPVSNMVAKHADGEMIGRTLLHFDMGLIRGAGAGDSGKDRGGAGALRAALKALKGGTTVAMTTDIPPGPARVAGLGIVTIARMSGRPILPAAVATGRFFTLPTWSRMTINLPFTRLALVVGDPIHVPRDADDAELERYRQLVEDAMNATTVRAYELAGGDITRTLPQEKLPPRKSGFLLSAYRGATWAARPAAMTILKRRAARGKEVPERLGERLGIASEPRPVGPLAWFHAASVGETNSVLALMDELKRRHPTLNLLLTTVTTTSAKIAKERLPAGAIHQFVPLDNPAFCKRFVEHWRPDLGLFVESEIWPNLIVEANGAGVPLALVNGRMSQRSTQRWRRLSSLSQPVFSRFDLVLTQNRRIAKRLKSLGARKIAVTGNLKYDAPPPPVDAVALDALRNAIGERPVFLAASTHPGEDDIVLRAAETLRAVIPSLLTVIAPRHPERGADVAALAGARGDAVARRSAGDAIDEATRIYVADTIGELGLFYTLAGAAFIGGSLVEHGGQNPIEAIKLDAAILSGPHTFNFTETYETLARFDGVRLVRDTAELAAAAQEVFEDREKAAKLKSHASAAIATLGGALEKTLEALAPWLPQGAPGEAAPQPELLPHDAP